MDNLVDRIKFGESCYDLEAVEELAIASFGYIEEDVRNIKKGYISLGFHLNEMWQSCYYEELGYEDFYECVEKNFGLDKSAVSRCISVWKEFAAYDENSYSRKMWVDERYANYSYSQLAEMLPLKQEERRRVTPDMSVREIREFKKNLKNKKAKKPIENAIEQKPVATSQPQEEKNADVKDYSCPPDVHSCVRKEWGTSEEEQKKGHEECNKCWKEYEKRKVIVATSQPEETPESQPELPDMKNMQEREDFVNSYKNWNIWCRNDLTEEVFYRFDLPDGAAIVVKNFPYYLEWKKEEREDREFYLLKPDYRHFANCKSSMTEIKEYLKNLRKKG